MKNKAKVLEALAADCELVGRYCDEQGNTCALGCLGRMAGYTDYELRGLGKRVIDCCDLLQAAIYEKFGLTHEQQWQIQIRNDDSKYDREERRRAVCEYVATLSDEGETAEAPKGGAL